jgi:hypothetical protein
MMSAVWEIAHRQKEKIGVRAKKNAMRASYRKKTCVNFSQKEKTGTVGKLFSEFSWGDCSSISDVEDRFLVSQLKVLAPVFPDKY